MDRTIVHGRPDGPSDRLGRLAEIAARHPSEVVGWSLVLGALLVYVASNPERLNIYNHFVWQASAWLDGQATIPYPVSIDAGLPHANDYFQDVLAGNGANGVPAGRALLPFPPLPALVLLPFVALFGLATNAQLIASVLGAADVGIAWWALGRLPIAPSVRVAAAIFFAVGTAFWYTAMEGTTWYLAHVVAVGLSFAAVGLALGGDPTARAVPWSGRRGARAVDRIVTRRGDGRRGGHALGTLVDGRQFLAGILLGLAATARLTVAFGLPFLLLVGPGAWPRRATSALLGVAIPLLAFAAYNLVSTGHPFNPAYDAVWAQEIRFYPPLYPYLEYRLDWGLEDLRYVPGHFALMVANPPVIAPACDPGFAQRALFDPACPVAMPRDDAMGLLWTSPGWLLSVPALARFGRARIVTAAGLAVLAIALVDLAHFSQGWVQFGYRFANDFAPFLLLLVALGQERIRTTRSALLAWIAAALIAASIVANWWGVVWGVTLGW